MYYRATEGDPMTPTDRTDPTTPPAAPKGASPERLSYPTDLSDAQWLRIEPVVRRKGGRGRKSEVSLREIVNALHYRWATGCTWRMLPHDFPPWNTVYFYYRAWRERGVLPQLRAMLIERPTVMELHEQQVRAKRDADRMAG